MGGSSEFGNYQWTGRHIPEELNRKYCSIILCPGLSSLPVLRCGELYVGAGRLKTEAVVEYIL